MSFSHEFRNFITRGNVVDLAVAVVVGQAFSKIGTALVEGLIMPLVSYVLPRGEWQTFVVGKLQVGKLFSASLDFLLIALVVFLGFVKGVGRFTAADREAEPVVKTKTCPYCLEEVPLAATRCRHCTSQLA
jgi:large conductance mechanosensitive channel